MNKFNMIDALILLFNKDLRRLKKEMLLYKDETNIWKIEGEITNTAGNLCLHLVGNLNYFIGTEIGKTDYIRKREEEFSLKNVPRVTLIKMVDETIAIVDNVLRSLTESQLREEYPIEVFKEKMTVGYFILRLNNHLNYHLGQINYHRRLLDV